MHRTAALTAITRALGLASALLVVLVGGGCSDFDGWDYSRYPGAVSGADGAATECDVQAGSCDCGSTTQPTDTSGTGRSCDPCVQGLVGRALKINSLVVTEPIVPTAPDPEALPKFLNKIWQEDVRRDVLNIMLRVDAVDLESGTLTMVGGAAWHDLTMDDLPEPGGELTLVPSSFFFISESNPFTVALDPSCTFTLTSDPPQVGFHPGPADHPNICTPEYENAIPIVNLVPTAQIAADCSGLVSGVLTGCIPEAAAKKICSWGPAPDYSGWYYTQDPDVTPIDGTPSYCQHWCGKNPAGAGSSWQNFGGFVKLIKVPIGCDSDGDGVDDGYRIRGEFTAEVVDYAEPQ